MIQSFDLSTCHHRFHPKCLLKWVSTGSLSCPLCRKDLPPFLYFDDVSTEEETETVSVQSSSNREVDRYGLALHPQFSPAYPEFDLLPNSIYHGEQFVEDEFSFLYKVSIVSSILSFLTALPDTEASNWLFVLGVVAAAFEEPRSSSRKVRATCVQAIIIALALKVTLFSIRFLPVPGTHCTGFEVLTGICQD
jgi:hypothetical protein